MRSQAAFLPLKHPCLVNDARKERIFDGSVMGRNGIQMVYLMWTPLHRSSHGEQAWWYNKGRITFVAKNEVLGSLIFFLSIWIQTGGFCTRFQLTTTGHMPAHNGFHILLMYTKPCGPSSCVGNREITLKKEEKQIYWSFKLPTDLCTGCQVGQRCIRPIKSSTRKFLFSYCRLLVWNICTDIQYVLVLQQWCQGGSLKWLHFNKI